MSIFDAGKVCTFSAVRATVTYKGEPVKGATVTRLTEWKKPNKETTKTDANGAFDFPAIFERSVSKYSLMEIVISQQITVEYNGQLFEIWANGKMNSEEDSEFDGVAIDLDCELTNEQKTYRSNGSLVMTNCTLKK
ncbi:DUF6795 domain-containing protein [Thalassolituus oleivorans]|uniref:DUF6795 domain-containing protein n=1 Tax=Thalassolituus oleivorans TaxID=187493 RepID=UPI0023F066D2|nr:DUF6795 domain-containing protein [Thalassolituus oleivorans]